MTAIEKLKEMFRKGEARNADGKIITFEGVLGAYSKGIEALEQELGYKIPSEIKEFLEEFGGTEIFINDSTPGLRIHPISEIAEYNKEQQKSTDPFFPKFVILAEDWMDDMMCLFFDGRLVHFGNLHHEAWAEPECWVSEAFTPAKFNDWLTQFIESFGADSIPNRKIQYEI